MSRQIVLGRRTFSLPFEGEKWNPRPSRLDRGRLRSAIKAEGCVRVAVLTDQHHNVIDGQTRLELAVELGLDPKKVPVEQILCETLERARELCFLLNTDRRHLTPRQLGEVVRVKLRQDATQSDRKVAGEVGVSHHKVRSQRKKMEAAGEIPPQPTRVGRDGSRRDAAKGGRSGGKPGGGKPAAEASNGTANGHVLVDALGQEVPRGLLDVFADRAVPDAVKWLEDAVAGLALQRYLNAVRRRAKELLYMRVEGLDKHLEQARVSLDLALEVLRHGAADCVCGWCKGAGCDLCRKQGHMPRFRYDELKAAGKL